MKKTLLLCFALLLSHALFAQETFPLNGIYDVRPGQYAFTNANIVVNADETITGGTLLIKDRKIEAAGKGMAIPKGYVVFDLKGKYIYPSLIDAYTTYGIPDAPRKQFTGTIEIVNVSKKTGPFGWNEAIKPEMNAKAIFHADANSAEDFKKNGFGTVQSLIHDGIARGTSVARWC